MGTQPDIPLAAQVLTRASFTMLAQVLGEDPTAQVTGLEMAPADKASARSQVERLKLSWNGAGGPGEREIFLKVLPKESWSEVVNPIIPAPVEILLVESDLSQLFGAVVEDTTLAAGRRTEERPAWILSEDSRLTPLDLTSEKELRWLLERSAAFHALHWGAVPVLDDVYPWLPRFSSALRLQFSWLAELLDGGDSRSSYGRWMERSYPDWRAKLLSSAGALQRGTSLRDLLANPDPLLERLEASPQTILHGQWEPEHLFRQDDRLVALGWSRAQVGPAAWDIATLLEAAAMGSTVTMEEELAFYLSQVALTITEISDEMRASFVAAFYLCQALRPLLAPAAQPPGWEDLEAAAELLTTML